MYLDIFEGGRQNEMKSDRPHTATGTTPPGKTMAVRTTAGCTTTEGTTTGSTTSAVHNNTGSPTYFHPPNTNIVSPCNVPQLLNTRPPLNSMASQFNTNAIPSSTACNEICHVSGKELGSGELAFHLSQSHPPLPATGSTTSAVNNNYGSRLNNMASLFNTNAMPASTAFNEMCHVCGIQLRSGELAFHLSQSHPPLPENVRNSTDRTDFSYQAPPVDNMSLAEINWIYPTRVLPLPARQTPIPLGGPEHGVLTYQYILTLAKNRAKSPGQFFKELMGIYFTEEELLRGNLKGGGANQALNPAIIGAILEETRRQYGDVRLRLATVVNEKCCRVRSSHKRRKKKSSVALQDANYMQL